MDSHIQIKQRRMSGVVQQCSSTMLIITFLFTVFKHSKDAIFIFDYLPYIEKNVKVRQTETKSFDSTVEHE
jgi:hypothetical protein